MPRITDDVTIADIAGKLNRPEEYLRRVLEHMWECKREFGQAIVRIGVTGEGRAPNYRIEHPEENEAESLYNVYNGLSHNAVNDLGILNIKALLDGFGPVGSQEPSARPDFSRPDRILHYDHWSTKVMTLDQVAALLGTFRKRR